MVLQERLVNAVDAFQRQRFRHPLHGLRSLVGVGLHLQCRQALRQRAVELCQRLIALQIPYQGLNAGHEPRQMLHRAQGRGQERLRAQGIDIRLKDHLTDGRQAVV